MNSDRHTDVNSSETFVLLALAFVFMCVVFNWLFSLGLVLCVFLC